MRIPSEVAVRPVGHSHFWGRAAEHGVTRRTFLGRSAGAMGAVAGLGLVGAAPAFAAGSDPKPIPGGIQPGGPGTPVFHLFLPGAGNEPSTITDFNGFVGITEMAGTGEDGNGSPFDFDVDLRFMKGLYAGEDGKLRQGAFAFVWLDLFDPSSGEQVHDFNPGITSSGLFWTIAVPDGAIDVRAGSGEARLQVSNQPLMDAFNVVNALFGGGPTPIAAHASFDVHWHGGGERNDVEDAGVGFSLHAVQGEATVDWSASNAAGFSFASSPSGQTTAFAEVGKERNGVFF